MSQQEEDLLRAAYRAFNARDMEAVIALMHPDVDWPNAWEGGRLRGHAAVREYWERQFASIDSRVEPETFHSDEAGDMVARVHQVVHDAASGELMSDVHVHHRYRIRDGLVAWMDVEDDAPSEPSARR